MILVDVHEPKRVSKVLGDLAHVESLEVGDYQFPTSNGKVVIVERKSSTDLLSSLSSGRFHEQVRNMLQEDCVPVLLLEGFMSCTKDGFVKVRYGITKWRYNSVQHMLMTAQLAGLYITKSPTVYHTPIVIKDLYYYFQKEDHESLRRRRMAAIIPGLEESSKLEMLTAIPGIGAELAKRLLGRFGTPLGVLSASDQKLLSVHGMGPKKLEVLRQVAGHVAVERIAAGHKGATGPV